MSYSQVFNSFQPSKQLYSPMTLHANGLRGSVYTMKHSMKTSDQSPIKVHPIHNPQIPPECTQQEVP
jgi:hypothetical protein